MIIVSIISMIIITTITMTIIIIIIILMTIIIITTMNTNIVITIMIIMIMILQIGVVMNIKKWDLKLIGINMIHIKIGKMLMMLKVKEYTLVKMKQLMMNGLKIYIIKAIKK